MVHMVMPGHVDKAFKEFQHDQPLRQQHSPYVAVPKRCGAKAQVMHNPEDFKEATAAEKKFIQQVTGELLYLARAVNGTLLTPLSVIASKQSSPTEDMLNRTKHFLDYTCGLTRRCSANAPCKQYDTGIT